MRLKKLGYYCVCLMLIILFSGCRNEQKLYYDNDKKISQSSDSFSYLTNSEESKSDNETNIKFSSFDGTDTIWNIEAQEDSSITFKYETDIKGGKCKGVLITPEDKVEKIFEGSQDDEKNITLNKGNYRFKLVGKSAKGEVNFKIDSNDKVKTSRKRMWD